MIENFHVSEQLKPGELWMKDESGTAAVYDTGWNETV